MWRQSKLNLIYCTPTSHWITLHSLVCVCPLSFQPNTTAAVFDESHLPPQRRNRLFSRNHWRTVAFSQSMWHRLVRESKNHFVFGVDEALRSRFCVRQMQSEKVKHLCRRLQLPRMDLQSYQVEGCWRCNIWSPLSPLWQRTEPDHWRW